MQSFRFVNVESAREIVAEKFPEANSLKVIDDSYDNIVVLVDHDFAVRFPRNYNAYLRSLYERSLLTKLTRLSSVQVPQFIGKHDNPPFTVTSFLSGKHLTPARIAKFSEDNQKQFAEKVAEFAYELHTILSVREARSSRARLGLDKLEEAPWDVYFKKEVYSDRFPTLIQRGLAKVWYGRWLNKHVSTEVVVHDDLHTANMFFEGDKLVGVLDFGDTNIGSPEEELRQMYRINDYVLETAINKYEALSGLSLDINTAKTWAVMQELAVYSRKADAKSIPQLQAASRASKNLNMWLPEGDWGKGLEYDEIDDGLQ